MSSLQVIAEQLKQLELEEAEIDEQILSLINNRDKLFAKLSSVNSEIDPFLTKIDGKAADLRAKIDSTDLVAISLASKVRRLDDAQGRLRDALERVDMIIDLKHSITVVKEAIEKKNYALAASSIHRILGPFRNKKMVEVEEESGNVSFRVLMEMEKKVSEGVVKRTQEMKKILEGGNCEDQVVNEALELCKIYPLVNLRKEGLENYCSFLVYSIKNRIESKGYALSCYPANSVIDHADLVTRIIDEFGGVLMTQCQVIQSHFGAGTHLRLLQAIQKLFDKYVLELLEDYIASNALKVKASAAQNAIKKLNAEEQGGPPSPKSRKEALDVHKVDELLQGLEYLCRESNLFLQDLTLTIEDALNVADLQNGVNTPRNERENFFYLQNLDIVGIFLSLEEYYMVVNVARAIEMEELMDSVPPTSSVVDDVFFVLKRSVARCFALFDSNTLCAIINLVTHVLSKKYYNVLSARLQQTFAAANLQKNFAGAVDNAEQCVILNNIEHSRECIGSLRAQILHEVDRSLKDFPGQAKQVDNVTQCLGDFDQQIQKFKRLVDKSLRQISKSILVNLKNYLDIFQNMDLNLKQKDYAKNEMIDPFMDRFVFALQQECKKLKDSFVSKNLDRILFHLMEHIAFRLEKIILQKQWGALQFDRDLRKLITFFSETSNRSVRDVFSRATQLSTILQMENIEELLSYWTNDREVWVFTVDEIKQILKCRIEFSEQDIAKMELHS